MTQLYFIRHGIAVERDNLIKDEDRPLTDVGQQKTQKVAQRLKEIKINFDMILTSPLLRARQTATILQNAGLSDKLVEFSPLSPGGSLQLWLDWWHNSDYHHQQSTIALNILTLRKREMEEVPNLPSQRLNGKMVSYF